MLVCKRDSGFSPRTPILIYQGKIQGELIVTSKKVAAIAGNAGFIRVSMIFPVQRLTGPDFGITGQLAANNRKKLSVLSPSRRAAHRGD
jgi:hypothetical protein